MRGSGGLVAACALALAGATRAQETVATFSPGIEELLASPALRTGERIACYGDSLTRSGGWIAILERAFAQRLPDAHVIFLNRGLDGATSTDLLHGVDDPNRASRGEFLRELARDDPSLVVLFVGVEDVRLGEHGTPRETYGTALRELAGIAARNHRRVVVCTPAVIGERKDGANPLDRELDDYAHLALAAARAADTLRGPEGVVTTVAGCDLRGEFRRALAERNVDDRESGVLTTDGVHMRPEGDALIADRVAEALARAIAMPEPPPELGLVPAPRSVEARRDRPFPALASVRVTASNQALESQRAALESELAALGVRIDPERGTEVALSIDTTLGFRDLYQLSTHSTSVSIAATREEVVPLACADFLQLFAASIAVRELPKVPSVKILDGPSIEFRALAVDFAGDPSSVRALRRIVELCRFYKLGFLVLRLGDGRSLAFASSSLSGRVSSEGRLERGELAGLVAFADARGVTLVPELGLACDDEELVAAAEALVDEFCDLFGSSPWFHLGAGAGERERRELLARMDQAVRKRGKRTLVSSGFEPGGEPPLPEDLVVVADGLGPDSPDALVRDGFRVVNAASTPLSLAGPDLASPEAIFRWNRYLWRAVDGVPGGMQVDPTDRVIGALLDARGVPPERALELFLERAPVFAERLWRPRMRGTFADLERRRELGAVVLAKLLAAVE